ncbi:D-sedoheptulose-7-phosphate isomerase [Rathayibacter toxicus]|uniref:D-sedoheptulose-7-phosphate isomerase n=1 Tax=Rathayibacter toxicus TaxID=145458 RepID=UPI0004121B18|nr:SIS domain-containing protein [Rathayibacter toxicus]ALS57993.1 hypothetical protein APU90_09655 [Rathayibacter toxicus]QOD09041.1 SIS domain-containing protein [Rathayibacter toxicus]QOD11162.1 SIS domain-containing protein [Rathayibacter toxicus]
MTTQLPSAATASVIKRYLHDLSAVAERIDTDQVAAAFDHILEQLHNGRTVFLAGNGGSASAASHIASDWLEAARAASRSAGVVSLADNVATVTRIANDNSYDEIFSRQLESFGAPGDVLVLLSVSGCSQNLVTAANTARAAGYTVVSLLGAPGELAQLSDIAIVMGDGDFGLTEDLHVALGHALVRKMRGQPHVCAAAIIKDCAP